MSLKDRLPGNMIPPLKPNVSSSLKCLPEFLVGVVAALVAVTLILLLTAAVGDVTGVVVESRALCVLVAPTCKKSSYFVENKLSYSESLLSHKLHDILLCLYAKD